MIILTTVLSGSRVAESLISKWANAQDHAQAKLLRSAARQHDFLLTRAALRVLLASATETDGWRIRPDAQGKPLALMATGVAGPHISLSHTRGLIACAVSQEGPVGIDVEHWRMRNFASLADYAFGPREREEVNHDGMPAFYRIWALREAMSKATGKGLIAAIDGRDRAADAPASGCWITGAWRLFYTSSQTNYSLAIACEGKGDWSGASLAFIDMPEE